MTNLVKMTEVDTRLLRDDFEIILPINRVRNLSRPFLGAVFRLYLDYVSSKYMCCCFRSGLPWAPMNFFSVVGRSSESFSLLCTCVQHDLCVHKATVGIARPHRARDQW